MYISGKHEIIYGHLKLKLNEVSQKSPKPFIPYGGKREAKVYVEKGLINDALVEIGFWGMRTSLIVDVSLEAVMKFSRQ